MTDSQTIRLYGTVPDSIVDGPGLRFAVFVQGCTHACPGCHNPQSQPSCGGEIRSTENLIAEIQANKLAQGITLSGGEPFEQAVACAEIAKAAREQGLTVWTYTGYRYEHLRAIAALAPESHTSEEPASSETQQTSNAPAAHTNTSPAQASNTPATHAGASPTLVSTPEAHLVSPIVARSEAAFATAPPLLLPAVDPAGARDLLAHTNVLVDGPFVQKHHSYTLQWRGSTNQRLIDIAASQTQGSVVLWHTHEDFPEKPASW